MEALTFDFSIRSDSGAIKKFLMVFVAKNGKFLHFCKSLLKMENIVKFVNFWDWQILPISDHYFFTDFTIGKYCQLALLVNCKYMVVYVYNIQTIK